MAACVHNTASSALTLTQMVARLNGFKIGTDDLVVKRSDQIHLDLHTYTMLRLPFISFICHLQKDNLI